MTPDHRLRLPPWLAAVLLGLLALAWRIPYAAHRPLDHIDEKWFALPTVQKLVAGEWLFYIAGTNYGAPVQEWLAAGLFAWFGESPLTLRLPVVVIAGVAIGVSFLVLRKVTTDRVALGICLLLACANSAIARYGTFVHPCYATMFLAVAILQGMTWWVDARRSVSRWLLLGVAMGAALYLLKLSILQSGVSLLWLAWRSDYLRRVRSRLADPWDQPPLLLALGSLAVAGLALLPVGYRYLTRRDTYHASAWEMGLLIVALLALVAVIYVSLRFRLVPGPFRREWIPVAACLALIVTIPRPADLWYAGYPGKTFAPGRSKVWGEAAYSLKHVHQWPLQGRLFLQGILPALLVGQHNQLEGYPPEEVTPPGAPLEPLGARSLVSLVFLGLVGVGVFRQRRRIPWGRLAESPAAVITGPFLATLAVMLPAWSLHSETCYRYLWAFVPGFYLLAYYALRGLPRWEQAARYLLPLAILYAGWDCYHHMF